jgi:ABC-2 type transport system permease protein
MKSHLTAAIWAEFLKARRSRVPLYTALGFSLAPLMGGFFMVILKDPEAARRVGILRAKVDLLAGQADWPSYFQLLGQATAVGGVLLFSLIASWIFGREYSDRTAKDLMALPTPRSTIVWAKFIVMAAWALGLAVFIIVLGILVGWVVGMPGWTSALAAEGVYRVIVAALLTVLLMPPIAYAASAGGGYMAPMGVAIVLLVMAQVLGAAGWGPIFPWSIPATYAGMGNAGELGIGSYAIVLGVGGLGAWGTVEWWRRADQGG